MVAVPRLSLKPDASFFKKIATGAVGVQAVCRDLSARGHRLVDLERGHLRRRSGKMSSASVFAFLIWYVLIAVYA
jgi:hypothetical protein